MSVWPQSWRTPSAGCVGVRRQRRQVRSQVVAAPRAGTASSKSRRPVRAVHLEAVAEDRERRRGAANACSKRVPTACEIAIERAAIVVIEHEAFAADGRALDHHARAAGDEDQQLATCAAGREPTIGRRDVASSRAATAADGSVRRRQKRRDAVARRRRCWAPHALRPRRHRHALDAQLPGGMRRRHLRAAERPAAAEREVEAQAELARLVGGEAQRVEERRRTGTARLRMPVAGSSSASG